MAYRTEPNMNEAVRLDGGQYLMPPIKPKPPAPPVIVNGIQTCISTDMRDAAGPAARTDR